MAVLSDPKREKFAQLCARGIATVESYVRAGYKRNTGNAVTMRKRPDVTNRIAEIQEQLRRSSMQEMDDYCNDMGLNETYIIKQMLDTALAAKESGQFNVAITGLKDVGRELFGMFNEKKITVEQNVTHHNNNPTLAIQDFSGAFQRLADTLGGVEIEGEAKRLDEVGALVPAKSD